MPKYGDGDITEQMLNAPHVSITQVVRFLLPQKFEKANLYYVLGSSIGLPDNQRCYTMFYVVDGVRHRRDFTIEHLSGNHLEDVRLVSFSEPTV